MEAEPRGLSFIRAQEIKGTLSQISNSNTSGQEVEKSSRRSKGEDVGGKKRRKSSCFSIPWRWPLSQVYLWVLRRSKTEGFMDLKTLGWFGGLLICYPPQTCRGRIRNRCSIQINELRMKAACGHARPPTHYMLARQPDWGITLFFFLFFSLIAEISHLLVAVLHSIFLCVRPLFCLSL